MQIHGRAKLGPAGRLALCQAVEGGMMFRQAAAAMCVAPATAHRWWHRYAVALPAERASLAWAADRPSRPHHSPRLLSSSEQQRICEVRRDTGWGPRLVAGVTGHSHSTVWKVLHRHGQSRRPRERREATNRYEWPCPGDLLHIDVKSYPRFDRPGHALTGDRSRPGKHKRKHLGQDYAHAAVDDHSRLAFSELHPDERSGSVLAFIERALAFYASHGITITRILTDNAWSYTATVHWPSCSPAKASSTRRSAPTGPRQTGRWSASTKRWPESGVTAWPTPAHSTAPEPCHTGSSTTTSAGHTQRSATGHPSAAFTTYVGRTPRSPWGFALRPDLSVFAAFRRR